MSGLVGYRASPWDEPGLVVPAHTKTVENSDLVVTVSEAKDHLSYPVEDGTIDTTLSASILAAQRAIEHHCALDLLTTTWRTDLPYLDDAVFLEKRPYQSLTSIEYVKADDGEITTIATDQYHAVSAAQMQGAVYLGEGLTWPSAADRADAFRITFQSGWATADDVPQDVKLAVLMTVAKLDAKRGDCDGGGATSVYAMKNASKSIIPAGAASLLDPYKLRELFLA